MLFSLALLFATFPWIVLPIIAIVRLSKSRFLRDESAVTPANAPRVSVIIPARNEARNIGACLQSILTSTYPHLELIVVNDHSTDSTDTIVREIAANDGRVTLLQNPPLPTGWFGKQWACQNGSHVATGDIFLFIDADTRLAPEAITRSVNALLRTKADLFSVLSEQEMHSFWERVVQPQILTVLGFRYGGSELINASNRASDKIANGQFLMIPRATYEAMHGHALVRSYVAEDLRFAQLYFAADRKPIMMMGYNYVTTRMYTSLPEIIAGWQKNVYAGGRDAIPFGRLGQLIFPFVLPLPALFELVPVVVLILGVFGVVPIAVTSWAGIVTVITLIWWTFAYRATRESLFYAFTFPLGAAILLYIFITAIVRGHKVSWKNRTYTDIPLERG